MVGEALKEIVGLEGGGVAEPANVNTSISALAVLQPDEPPRLINDDKLTFNLTLCNPLIIFLEKV